nr:MAG TPA: hypothetical protein [Caudoviricetes sp.]
MHTLRGAKNIQQRKGMLLMLRILLSTIMMYQKIMPLI